MRSDNGHIRYLNHLTENIKKALYFSGKLVEGTAQEYSPHLTGTMERSVTTTPARKLKGKFVVQVGPGPEAPYAQYTELEEYMTTKKGKRKQLGAVSAAKGARMPWLKPALKDNQEDIKKLLKAAIRETR